MKNRIFTGFAASFLLLIVLELPALAASAAEADCALVHADAQREWYINTRTLVSPAPGKISFWNRIVPVKGSAYSVRAHEMLKKAGKDPDRLAYLQTLEEIDCTRNTSKIWSLLFYDRQDRIVLSLAGPQNDAPAIIWGKEADLMRKRVCTSALYENGARYLVARSEDLHEAPGR
jgi:hypothetical protein